MADSKTSRMNISGGGSTSVLMQNIHNGHFSTERGSPALDGRLASVRGYQFVRPQPAPKRKRKRAA